MSSKVAFTTIPPELRMHIYEYVASEAIIDLNRNRRSDITSTDTLGILFISRQIHDEAFPVFRKISTHLLTLPVFRAKGEPYLNGLPESLCEILSQISNLDLQIEFRSFESVPVLDFDAQGLVPPPCQVNDEGQERRYYVEGSAHNMKVQMSLQVDDLVSSIEAGASLQAFNLSIEVDKMLGLTSNFPPKNDLGQCLHRIGDIHGLVKDVYVEGDPSLKAKFRRFEVTGDKKALCHNNIMLPDFTLQGYEWDEEPDQDWVPAELGHEDDDIWWPNVSESSESYDYEYGDIDDEEPCESYSELLEQQNEERKALDSQPHDNAHVWSARDKLAQFGIFAPDSVFNNSPGLYDDEPTRCQKCFAEKAQE